MNERELDLALDRLGVEHVRRTAPSALRDRVHVVPLETKPQSWLLRFPMWRFQPMFSATKFVVAGAIVALFGGFLLSGVLTQPSEERIPAAVTDSPDPSTQLLPGVDLVTEEVEPGVYRVVGDGIRDLSRSYEVTTLGQQRPFKMMRSAVILGLDGSVWAIEFDRFFRIGEDATHHWDGDYPNDRGAYSAFAVGPDGTLWQAGPTDFSEEVPDYPVEAALRSFDGREWDVRVSSSDFASAADVAVASDGAVWASWADSAEFPTECLGRLVGDAWEVIEVPGSCALLHDPAGHDFDLWSLNIAAAGGHGTWIFNGQPRHLDGDTWRTIQWPSGLAQQYTILDAGLDGTVWVQDGHGTLGRFDGTEWRVYDKSDGYPLFWDPGDGDPSKLRVAPDQSVWYPASGAADDTGRCGGVARFDGTTATQYLTDHCVSDLDISPDGKVWVRAIQLDPSNETDVVHTYVITPEAVAAAE